MNITASRELFIFGFGGHARSVADVAIAAGWGKICFIDERAAHGETFVSFQVLKDLPAFASPSAWCFPAAGDNDRRQLQLESSPLSLATIISPAAWVGVDSSIGEGTLVCHGSHVGPSAKIGRGVILNTHAVVEHESTIGDFTHISVNATVAGRVRIGCSVMVSAGAVVIDSISICDGALIGAGAVVTENIDEPGVYVGVPARRIR